MMDENEPKKTEGDAAEDSLAADRPVDDQAAPDEAGTDELVPALEARIRTLEEENAQLRDQALRALAEAENTRRRAERDREDSLKYAVTKFARDLLSVSDNLRRALDAMPEGAAAEFPALATVIDGVAATERELLSVFQRHGLTRIDAQGQKFDANYHQAVFEVPNSGQPAGTIVQVMAPGWLLQGRLLRPAMVGVAKGDPAPQPRFDTTA